MSGSNDDGAGGVYIPCEGLSFLSSTFVVIGTAGVEGGASIVREEGTKGVGIAP